MTSAAALAVLLASAAPGVGWTQAAGDHYIKLGGRAVIGSGGYLADGSFSQLGATFVDARAELYAEFGVFDRLTIVGIAAPLGWATFGDTSTAYLGPLSVGARVGTDVGPFPHSVFALEARYGYSPPLGEVVLAAGWANGRRWQFVPAVETHRFDIEAQLGVDLPWGLWFAGAAGLGHATREGMGASFNGMLQLGIETGTFITGEAHFTWHQPTHYFSDSNIAGAGNTAYLGAGVSVSAWLTPTWGAFVGVDGGFWVYSNAGAPAFTIGLEHRTEL